MKLLLFICSTFCRPLLLNGCDGVSLSPSQVDSQVHSFNRIYLISFKVNDIQSITDIQCYMNLLSISEDTANRRFRFMRRAKESSNSTMYFLANFLANLTEPYCLHFSLLFSFVIVLFSDFLPTWSGEMKIYI